ncbi:hypothetical protein CYMTET_6099 [Cymbomonas tetramitiformis]|uniref:Uncharacterized protein n=1 Tax=Cymbomonas tetramitiformis TaxID=36881 RepID=A0AAE0GY57_9CHLO|nr:hypothetical protein CYMTET_6099 [Cymbomonas tetramitiformis]
MLADPKGPILISTNPAGHRAEHVVKMPRGDEGLAVQTPRRTDATAAAAKRHNGRCQHGKSTVHAPNGTGTRPTPTEVEFFDVHNQTISADTANDLRKSCKWNVCMRDELRVAMKLPEVCWYENDQSFTQTQYQHVQVLPLRQGEWYIRVLEDHYQAVRGRIKQVSDDKTMFDIPTLPRWETCLKDASSSSSPEPPLPVSPLSPYPYSFGPPLPQHPPPTVLTPSSEDMYTGGNSSKAIDNITTYSPTMLAVPFMWSVDVSMPIDLEPVRTGAQYTQVASLLANNCDPRSNLMAGLAHASLFNQSVSLNCHHTF